MRFGCPRLLIRRPLAGSRTWFGNWNGFGALCVWRQGDPQQPRGCTILLVEDEPLIAFDIASELQRSGAWFKCRRVEQALAFLDDVGLSAAMLDYRLGDGAAYDSAISDEAQDPLCRL